MNEFLLGIFFEDFVFRFQNRRMKWRNTKDRDLFLSKTSSLNIDKNDCCDCEPKDDSISYYSSVLNSSDEKLR